jgi:cyanophycinase
MQMNAHEQLHQSVFNNLLFIMTISLMLFFGCTEDKPDNETAYNQSFGPGKGHLVVAGGNLTDSTVFNRFMELAGGPNALVVIVSTALTDDEINPEFYLQQQNRFESYGFQNFTFRHTRNRDTANMDSFTKSISEAGGVWFLGGRQWRLVDAYAGTKTLDEFNKLLERGGVIGGSSAGASIQADFLVRGDTKTNTVMMGDHQEGFGFLKNVAIDQHLLAMNRQFDIFEILDAHPVLLGIGLDENTAIIVSENTFEVIGKSYVAIYDGTFYQEVRDKDDWSHVVGKVTKLPEGSQKFYLLKNGQKYDLYNRAVIQ